MLKKQKEIVVLMEPLKDPCALVRLHIPILKKNVFLEKNIEAPDVILITCGFFQEEEKSPPAGFWAK